MKNEIFYLKRECSKCGKFYDFTNVKKQLISREGYHEFLGMLWNQPDIEFYCSSCLILKIIKELKKNRNKPKSLISEELY